MLKQIDTQHIPLVLVADDQLSTAVMLERVFEYEGYRVHKTFDGVSAFEAVQTLMPDLVLLDINMPGLTGFDVLKKMREDPRTARIPTIIITAIGDFSKVVEGLNLGADDYLKKPFHPQELLARAKSKLRAFQLETQLYQRTQELESLLRLSEELNLYPENGDLLEFVTLLIADLVPNRSIQIYQLDHDRNIAHTRTYATNPNNKPFPFEEYLQKHADLKQDIIQWDDMQEYVNHQHATTAILRTSNDILGLLVLGTDTAYTENQFQLFRGLSRQIALALRKAELYNIQQRYANHLEEMVATRTAELESAQKLLIRSEKLASIGRIAGEIAHEIKNPLMPIRICLDNVKEDIESKLYDGDMGMVSIAFDSIERINYIVDSLRAFMGNKQLDNANFAPVDLNHLIEQLTTFNRRILDNIQIETHLSPLPLIEGNRFQLEQIFQNLMVNARDAMPKGGTLIISSSHDAKDVTIEVKDTGKGIEPSIIESVFEPFVSTKESGNGLGLFISYAIIQKHKGNIHVESEVGKGTTFIIRLPIPQS
ncbi:MAG TPA: response regulator [Aggregatilineales bacterium]|nr:response regulator [Aggregatilineales bacterium]